MNCLCDLLQIQHEGVRKRATNCIGQFAIILSNKQLQHLMTILIDRLKRSTTNRHDLLVQIQCISNIARTVGNKLSTNFSQLLPILQTYPSSLDEDQSKDLENEISEAALIAIENLIRKCSNEAKQSIKTIFNLSKHCLVYDPNYHYNSDEEEQDENMEDAEEGWGSDFYDDEQDDDDDTAWKVRKSAIKIIDAIIVSCPIQLKEYWTPFMDLLSKRFVERDDNVKVEILETFQTLIKASMKVEEEGMGGQGFGIEMKKQRSYAENISNIYP